MPLSRFVSVHFPWWSVERIRRQHARQAAAASPLNTEPRLRHSTCPILLITVQHGVERIARYCPRAAGAGVRFGITLAHAQSLLGQPQVLVETHNPARESAALDRLSRAATRFSPTVTPDWPDGLLLDITGCQRLFKGEHRLLSQLSRWLTGQGFTAKLAVAPTIGGAWALARHAPRPPRNASPNRWPSVDLAGLQAALAPLPIASLRLTLDSIFKLHTTGIRYIHQLLALSKADLADRIGPDEVLKIHQALGVQQELLVPHHPSEPIVFERIFDGPCPQIQAIEIATQMLINEACAWLLSRESGLTRLGVTLQRSDLPPLEQPASFSRPTRDARHIWSVLRPSMEKAHLGWGALAIRLQVLSHSKLTHKQTEAWAPGLRDDQDSSDAALGVLMDQWTSRLGAGCILRPELTNTHIPERKSALTAGATPKPITPASEMDQPTPELPPMLFDTPEPVLVELSADDASAPPTCIHWRGRQHAIIQSTGPQRITPEWWRPDSTLTHTRDYHRLQDSSGRWLWVYEDLETSRWFIHGVWA